MGKIKSAIITTLLSAAIAVLALFALVTLPAPGSNGVERYDSFVSSIHLGGDLTGNATTVLYPEGVLSATEYAGLDETAKEDYVKHANYDIYVKSDVLEDNGGAEGLKKTVSADADVLSKRFGEKGYSSYSVAVVNDYAISVTVPTNFTYADYKKDDFQKEEFSTIKNAISNSLVSLAYNGELSLRNTEVGNTKSNNILTKLTDDVTAYFSGIGKQSVGGNHAVKVNLTKEGREQFKSISAKVRAAETDKAIGFYVGDYQLLSLDLSNATEDIDSNTFYIPVEESRAEDYSIVLNSIASKQLVTLDYNSDEAQIVYTSAELGDTAALFLGVAMLLIVVGAIAFSIARYKKLGAVNMLIILVYALALITALMLLEIQVTLAGAITAVIGLALLCGSNFATFEAVRKETLKGKTIQSSVKEGYKTQLKGILEMHAILIIVSILLGFVGVGEFATCGLILFITTVASYVLYWFTRFMWYVISSPVKDKFKFCGYKREELEDD